MLLPNNKQETRMSLTASAARYAYNWALGTQMDYHSKTHIYMHEYEIRKLFTVHKQENQWLYKYSNSVTKQALRDCCGAFKSFVQVSSKAGYIPYNQNQLDKANRENKELSPYDMRFHPKFKKKNETTPSFYIDTLKVEFSDTHVKLEKISDKKNKSTMNWIRLAEKSRIPVGLTYCNPRVTYDGLHWWVSVGIKVDNTQTELTEEVLGVDVGIINLAVLSDATHTTYGSINNSTTIINLKKQRMKLQRKISNKYELNMEDGNYKKTKNIRKSEKKLLKINRRISDVRNNYLHQTTKAIIEQKPRMIVLEDLNIKGMMKNRHLAKSIHEQGLYEFRRQIEYKSHDNGIIVVKAKRNYPSSKMCSNCGSIHDSLKLNNRTYKCKKCGVEIDRDINAAINLAAYGINIISKDRSYKVP